ncbi:MAG: hypothetical protein ACI8TX_000075 [Hyphomicrobiaceae bacterium]|jgi:hypothetical protein
MVRAASMRSTRIDPERGLTDRRELATRTLLERDLGPEGARPIALLHAEIITVQRPGTRYVGPGARGCWCFCE